MKRLTIMFTALAAITGVGSAFTPSMKATSPSQVLVNYDWSTVGGTTVFFDMDRNAVFIVSDCEDNRVNTCLYATAANGANDGTEFRVGGNTIVTGVAL